MKRTPIILTLILSGTLALAWCDTEAPLDGEAAKPALTATTDPEALLSARTAYENGDYVTAFKHFSELSETGIAGVQYALGVMYDKGQGVTQDVAEAARWYRRAAEQGFAKAQYNLGWMYKTGHGVTRDYQAAKRT